MRVTPPRASAGCDSAGSSRRWLGRLGSEVGGADLIAEPGVSPGAAPEVLTRGQHRVGPPTVGLHPVVKAAQHGEIRRGCLPGWPVLVVGHHVVQVAGPGRSLAPREHTRPVTKADL